MGEEIVPLLELDPAERAGRGRGLAFPVGDTSTGIQTFTENLFLSISIGINRSAKLIDESDIESGVDEIAEKASSAKSFSSHLVVCRASAKAGSDRSNS
jgi:hypothetical protein